MSQVLLTGFAPFRRRRVNSSSEALRALPPMPSVEVLTDVPVMWADEQIVTAARTADIVIAVGEARMRAELRLERHARNVGRGVDESGARHHGPLHVGGMSLPTTIPLMVWQQAVDAVKADGIDIARPSLLGSWPARLGLDVGEPHWPTSAGTFLCNATFYRLLRAAGDKWIGFVHVRADGDPVRLARGLSRIVEVCLANARSR